MFFSHIDCHNAPDGFQNNQRFFNIMNSLVFQDRQTWCEIYRSLRLDAV
jgi:hypothetical protein